MGTERSGAALETVQKFLVVYRYLHRYGHELHSAGLRGRELAVLRYLYKVGPRTIGQLKSYLFISNSSTSELVSRMEGAGYVARRRSERDSRVVFVELTLQGRQMAEEAPLGGIPLLRERLGALSPDRLRTIDEAFSYLIDMLEINSDEFC